MRTEEQLSGLRETLRIDCNKALLEGTVALQNEDWSKAIAATLHAATVMSSLATLNSVLETKMNTSGPKVSGLDEDFLG